MESYIKAKPTGYPKIPSERAYMDLKTFTYKGIEIGVMFGGFNGMPLDDTWFFIPSYGNRDLIWLQYEKQNDNTPYPGERNSYAMAPWNNGVIMAGGLMDIVIYLKRGIFIVLIIIVITTTTTRRILLCGQPKQQQQQMMKKEDFLSHNKIADGII